MLWDYTKWGDTLISDILYKIPDDEFERKFEEAGSIRLKIDHMTRAYRYWANQISPFDEESPLELEKMRKDELLVEWTRQQNRMNDILRTINDFDSKIQHTILKADGLTNSISEISIHLFNHQNYHRGQIIIFLRLLHRTPVSSDFIEFINLNRIHK